jgi:glycerol-3-phosphate acyltransferase PlsX
MVSLKKIPGISRPAIAAIWPCDSPVGYKLALDMGANIHVDSDNLVDFSVMGAEYARLFMGVKSPRVGLLNIGHENSKGHTVLQDASQNLIHLSQKKQINFDYVGFVEGGAFFRDSVDVIVTDGFTGNIALKTAEGTARFIGDNIKQAFRHSWASRLGALIAYSSLKRLRKRLDPSRANGGVFLGINGTVVKSHGSSNALAFASAVSIAVKLSQANFVEEMTKKVTEVAKNKHTISPNETTLDEKALPL